MPNNLLTEEDIRKLLDGFAERITKLEKDRDIELDKQVNAHIWLDRFFTRALWVSGILIVVFVLCGIWHTL